MRRRKPTVADWPAGVDRVGRPAAPADASNGRHRTRRRAVPARGGRRPGGLLPGYDRMTLAQVSGHLRDLTADDVSALLDYEQSASNRAPFLTLLSNRLVTLGAQES